MPWLFKLAPGIFLSVLVGAALYSDIHSGVHYTIWEYVIMFVIWLAVVLLGIYGYDHQ